MAELFLWVKGDGTGWDTVDGSRVWSARIGVGSKRCGRTKKKNQLYRNCNKNFVGIMEFEVKKIVGIMEFSVKKIVGIMEDWSMTQM